ncbi:MAG: hypothetical protein ACE5GM_09515 [bacterium]
MKPKAKKPVFFLLALFVIFATVAEKARASEFSYEGKEKDTGAILSLFGVLGESVTKTKPKKKRDKTGQETVFPDYLVPTELKNGVSSKTIEAETQKTESIKNFSKKQSLFWKYSDDRQIYEPNYKVIISFLLAFAYLLCSFLVHRHHHHQKKRI